MVIDFHTHAFPAELAAKATSKNYILPVLNGSYESLSESMTSCGVDYSLILPISTREGMSEGLNIKASKISEISGDMRMLSFGSVYPGEINWDKEVDAVKKLGLKGIKIQPSFQNCLLSDAKIYELVRYALGVGLYVIIHVGPDYPTQTPECATPRMAADLLSKLDNTNKLIFAHLGGYNYPEDAFNMIAGSDVFLDTSMCTEAMGDEMIEKIIKKHGSNKVLFGSDSPWYSQKSGIDDLKRLNLSNQELDNILFKNAAKILEI